MLLASLGATGLSRRNLRFRFADFWLTLPGDVALFAPWRRSSFPPAVTLNRFFAPLCVFCFGISRVSRLFRRSRVLARSQHHHHVAAVEKRRLFHDSYLLHVLRQPHQQVTAALRVGGFPPTEHDRH